VILFNHPGNKPSKGIEPCEEERCLHHDKVDIVKLPEVRFLMEQEGMKIFLPVKLFRNEDAVEKCEYVTGGGKGHPVLLFRAVPHRIPPEKKDQVSDKQV
jgi:hypothetical protein